MSQKIKKHLEDRKEYSIYEITEEKNIARKEDKIKPGDIIDAKEMHADHSIIDVENRVELAIRELALIFSKI